MIEELLSANKKSVALCASYMGPLTLDAALYIAWSGPLAQALRRGGESSR